MNDLLDGALHLFHFCITCCMCLHSRRGVWAVAPGGALCFGMGRRCWTGIWLNVFKDIKKQRLGRLFMKTLILAFDITYRQERDASRGSNLLLFVFLVNLKMYFVVEWQRNPTWTMNIWCDVCYSICSSILVSYENPRMPWIAGRFLCCT